MVEIPKIKDLQAKVLFLSELLICSVLTSFPGKNIYSFLVYPSKFIKM